MANPSGLHPKNKHKKKYDFSILFDAHPTLKEFVFTNDYNTKTIDFANPKAVKELNRALLFTYYNLGYWEFPDSNLCPPIPGRVDYIHYVKDLLKQSNIKNVSILDIGTGASCIYAILGNAEYGWKFVAADIDKKSLEYAKQIIVKNGLDSQISLRYQKNKNHIFNGILKYNDKFSVTICNPPFYNSIADAKQENKRKNKGLDTGATQRNFAGVENELCYRGGEKAFLHTYLYESSQFKKQCFWYTTLVSKKENVKPMYTSLEKLGATVIKTIPMHQGNKITRIVAWTFLDEKEQKKWGF